MSLRMRISTYPIIFQVTATLLLLVNFSLGDFLPFTSEVKACGNFICLTIKKEAQCLGDFPSSSKRQKPKLIFIYFPTVPRSGNTHTRKLWEAVTSIGSESYIARPRIKIREAEHMCENLEGSV